MSRWDIEEQEAREAEMDQWCHSVEANCSCTWPEGQEHMKYRWEKTFEVALSVCDWHRELKEDVDARRAAWERWRLPATFVESKLLWFTMHPTHYLREAVKQQLRDYLARPEHAGYLEAHPEIAEKVAAALAQ